MENPVGNTEDDGHEKENDPKDKGQNTLNNADKKQDNIEKINETQSHAKQEETISNMQEDETLHVNNNEKGKVIEVKDIVASVKPICKKNVTFDVMSGDDIRAILQLNTTPDLNRAEHKKFFCSIKLNKMQTIAKFYQDPRKTWLITRNGCKN